MLIKKKIKLYGNIRTYIFCVIMFIMCSGISITLSSMANKILDRVTYNGILYMDYMTTILKDIQQAFDNGVITYDDNGRESLDKIVRKYSDISVYVDVEEDGNIQHFYSSKDIDTRIANSGTFACYFKDGKKASLGINVLYTFGKTVLLYKRIICILIGGIIYIISIVIYMFIMQKHLTRLKKEVDYIGAGDLSRHIDIDENGDIGHIAKSVENLKNEMIKSRNNEIKAVEDKNNTARSLAHDIRTPLTIISGNLDLISLSLVRLKDIDNKVDEQKSDFEKLIKYIDICQENIEKIKDITTDVFAKEDITTIDMDSARSSYMNKWCEQLIKCGFTIDEKICYDNSVNINIKPNQFKRVLGNILSNICNYAVLMSEIRVVYKNDSIIISNLIKELEQLSMENKEHNYIGENLCEDIMKQMGGDYTKWIEDNYYYIKIAFDTIK